MAVMAAPATHERANLKTYSLLSCPPLCAIAKMPVWGTMSALQQGGKRLATPVVAPQAISWRDRIQSRRTLCPACFPP